MPHIIVECSRSLLSKNFNLRAMLADLHNSIDGIHNVTMDRLKTRAHVTDYVVVGEQGEKGDMVHINLRLFPGRSDEQKTELSAILKKVARDHLLPISSKCDPTVEVSELHGPSYQY